MVGVVELEMSPYLESIFRIINQYWHMNVYDSQPGAGATSVVAPSPGLASPAPAVTPTSRLASPREEAPSSIGPSHVSSSLGMSSVTFGVQLQMSCLDVIRALAKALQDDFKVHLTDLIPLILGVSYSAAASVSISPFARGRDGSVMTDSLLDVIGPCLENHLFLIVPPLMKLCEGDDEIRLECLKCISKLSTSLSFTSHASRVIHPLIRIADGLAGGGMDVQRAANAVCNLLVEMGSEYSG